MAASSDASSPHSPSIPASAHSKARKSPYPNSGEPPVERVSVTDDKVQWSVEWPEYSPPLFDPLSSASYKGPDASFDDVSSGKVQYKWNSIDGGIDRTSFHGDYSLDATGLPLNPAGRTGVKGRGHLWRWGPNHAADPIVTRWARDSEGAIETEASSSKPVLEFVAILRGDGGGWAIPGGMVEPGDSVGRTLQKEFGEEAMASLEVSAEERVRLKKQVGECVSEANGVRLYAGYVDDPRNTDNAWMETVAYNFHDETGEAVGKLPLKAGDDAAEVEWKKIDSKLELYASHSSLIQSVAELRKSHW